MRRAMSANNSNSNNNHHQQQVEAEVHNSHHHVPGISGGGGNGAATGFAFGKSRAALIQGVGHHRETQQQQHSVTGNSRRRYAGLGRGPQVSPVPFPLHLEQPSSYISTKMASNQWFLFPTLQNYSFAKQFLSDTVAGLTVGSLAVPQSMSYAMIAGLPVQNGLYSDLQVAYPVLGSSRHLVVGPVAIMSLLTMGALSGTGVEPFTHDWIVLCGLLAFIVGVFQLILSLFRLGSKLSNAVSENTVKAFTACAALTIASTQIQALLGVKHCPKGGCGFFQLIEIGLFENPNVETLMVSFLSFTILEGIRVVFSPKSLIGKMGSLIVLVVGCLIGYFFALANVQTIGYIPQGLPTSSPIFYFFEVATGEYLSRIITFAIPIALIGFAEAFAIAKSRSDPSYPTNLDPNRELAALGLANVWTAFLGGYACTGSFSRSAVNAEAGSTSGASNFVAALVVVVVLQILTGPLSYLPKACVSCVVISAILRLIDFHYVQELYSHRSWRKLASYLLVFVLGLVFGVEVGLMTGFLIDTIEYLWNRTRKPNEIAPETGSPEPFVPISDARAEIEQQRQGRIVETDLEHGSKPLTVTNRSL